MRTIRQKFLFTLACLLFVGIAVHAQYSQGDTIYIPADRYASIKIEAEWFDPATSFKIGTPSTVPAVKTVDDRTYLFNMANDLVVNYNINVGSKGGTYKMKYGYRLYSNPPANIRYWIDGAYLGGLASSAQTVLSGDPDVWSEMLDTDAKEVYLSPGIHTFGIRYNRSNTHDFDYFYLVPSAGKLDSVGTPATINLSADNGSVVFIPDYGLDGYLVGDTVQIAAIPNSGFLFDSWAGDVSGTNDTITVILTADNTITGNFIVDPDADKKILTVTVPEGIATYTLDPVQPLIGYAIGTSVTITATAVVDRDYRFSGWSGDTISTLNPLTIQIDSATSIVANFEAKTSYQQNDIYYLDANRYKADTIQMEWYHSDISSSVIQATEDGRIYLPAATLSNGKVLKYRIFVGETGGAFILTYIYRKQNTNGQLRVTLDGAKPYDDGQSNSFVFIPMPNLLSYPGEWDEIDLALPIPLTPGLHTLELTINASGTEDADAIILTPVAGSLSVVEAQLHVSAVNGTVAQSPNYGIHYNVGESVELTATPDYGFLFDGWTGDLVSAANPVTVAMDSAIQITANFVDDPAVADFTLAVSATHGTVVVSSVKAQYVDGTKVSLQANPDFGYKFTGWTGDLVSADNPAEVIMDANKNITANFEPLPNYNLNLTSANGTVLVDPIYESYPEGMEVTLTALENKDYRFTSWSGDVVDVNDVIVVTMTSDLNLTANFELKEFFEQGDTYYIDADEYKTDTIQAEWYDLDLSDEDSEVPPVFDIDTVYTFNYTIVGLDTIAIDTIATDTIFVTRTRNLKSIRYPVMVGAAGGTFNMRYFYRRLSADLNNLRIDIDGKKFDGLTPGYDAVAIPVTPIGEWSNFNVGAIVLTPGYHVITIKPHYSFRHDVDFFTLTPVDGTIDVSGSLMIDVDNQKGSVSRSIDKLVYDKGENVTLTATPETGYLFNGWTGDFVGTDNPLTVVMDSTIQLTANFVAAFSVTINAATINGTVEYTPVKELYPVGESVSFTPLPNAGYKFDGWFAEGGIGGTDIPLVIQLNSNLILTAFFSKITYVLIVTAENGAIQKSPSKISYDAGASVQLTAVPDNGYIFDSWSGDASGTENPLTITMDSAINITANFSKDATGIGSNKDMLFKVYPNPSNGMFTVDISENNVRYSVTDITGRVVKNGVGSGSFVIDMTESHKGIYAISIDTKNGVLVSRVIVE